MYVDTHEYNCIVFTNGRREAENTVWGLKTIEGIHKTRKDILAHHSSVGKEFRKDAENMVKDPSLKCTAVSTSTLELGIDIGDLDRVVQIGAPNSVSSFAQKFGRSGRRNGHPVMVIHATTKSSPSLPDIEVDLVRAVAEALLLLEDRWVEPLFCSRMPFSLLFQQTVSYVRSRVSVGYEELENDVLTAYPFRLISDEDYKVFLDYLVVCQVLDYHKPYRRYCLGSIGDRLSRHFDFGSNFVTIKEMDVYNDAKLVGSIQTAQGVGGHIRLSGHSWEVVSVDDKCNRLYVRPSESPSESYWRSGSADVHSRILDKMYRVLCSDEKYLFLDETAEEELEKSRLSFRSLGLEKRLAYVNGLWRLYPWLGTVHFDTLFRILLKLGIADSCSPPYSIVIREDFMDLDEIRSRV